MKCLFCGKNATNEVIGPGHSNVIIYFKKSCIIYNRLAVFGNNEIRYVCQSKNIDIKTGIFGKVKSNLILERINILMNKGSIFK